MSNNLSVIIPTYNEKENIGPLIVEIMHYVNPKEIIVVDDASPDGTARVAQSLEKRIPCINVQHNPVRRGLTASIQQGIDVAQSKYIAWLDADFSHPPYLLKQMRDEIKGADILVGSWLCHGGKDKRTEAVTRLFSFFINTVCWIAFGTRIRTYTSGYIFARKSILRRFRLTGNYGEYCIDLLVRNLAPGAVIKEIPFICTSRVSGVSKTGTNVIDYIGKGWLYIKLVTELIFQGYWYTARRWKT